MRTAGADSRRSEILPVVDYEDELTFEVYSYEYEHRYTFHSSFALPAVGAACTVLNINCFYTVYKMYK